MNAPGGSGPGAFRSEDGAVAAVVAIVLTVLLGLMAFVVDLGFVRADIRQSQSAGDAAALAGTAVLGESGDHQAACEAVFAYLSSNLGETFDPALCAPFSDALFNADGRNCVTRAASTEPATTDPTVDAPVYVQVTSGPYTIRVQMPVRDIDPQMTQQDGVAEFDGEPCERIAVSVRRQRNTIFGGFTGHTGPLEGFADAVSRYQVIVEQDEIASLVVLDPTGCGALNLTGNSSRLLVENLLDGSGDLQQRGLITVDSTGAGCGGPQDFVIVAGGSGARICAGVDPSQVFESPEGSGDYFLTDGFCDSMPNTLWTPSVRTDVNAARPYGRSVSTSEINNRQVEPIPTFSGAITRQIVDHEFNCREDGYPLSTASTRWHPLYESIAECTRGRAANMDLLAGNLAVDDDFLSDDSWEVLSGGDCTYGPQADVTVGDGTTNIYFDCNSLSVSGSLRIHPDQYIVVRGWVDAGSANDFRINVDSSGNNLDQDAVMVIQGAGTGTAQRALDVGSSAVVNINRTAVLMNTGSLDMKANSMRWTAPERQSYDADDNAVHCVEEQPFGDGVHDYDLPSPECFQKLAMWSNSQRRHDMTGGGQLDIAGVFFAPYAGRHQANQPFSFAGNSGQRMTKAQFFTYRFTLSGNSLVSMKPNPDFNIPLLRVQVSLVR
jgi:Flp pilus assembly protein TadG/microcompartment protein CcmK/EutM